MILARAVKEAGFDVSQAGNGKEALDIIDREGASLQLILVDWNMPGMSGLEVVQQIRARPELRDVRLMMVTTETEIEQMTRALEAGANEYLMKPFTREAIEDKLRLMGVVV